MSADHDEAPSGLDAVLDGGDEPVHGRRRRFGWGMPAAVALVVVVGAVAAVVTVGVALLDQVHVQPEPPGYRVWIDQTLGPLPPGPPPDGAIPGISVGGVMHGVQKATGGQYTPSRVIQVGDNRRTFTVDGHQLTVDLWVLGVSSASPVHSVSCSFHTEGPQSVDSAMVTVIRGCLFASVQDAVLSPKKRADLTDYVRTGKGGPQYAGGWEKVTVTDNDSVYGVVASAPWRDGPSPSPS